MGRDALGAMETDLSAELMVMPLEEGSENGIVPGAANARCFQSDSRDTCLSKLNVFLLTSIFVLSIMISATASAFCVIRRRGTRTMARKIFLTD